MTGLLWPVSYWVDLEKAHVLLVFCWADIDKDPWSITIIFGLVDMLDVGVFAGQPGFVGP